MFDKEECYNYFKTYLAVHYLGHNVRPFVITRLNNFINDIINDGRQLSLQDWTNELKKIARNPGDLKIKTIPVCGKDIAGHFAARGGTAVEMDTLTVFKIVKNCNLFTENRGDALGAISKVLALRNAFSHCSTKYPTPKLNNLDKATCFDDMTELLQMLRGFGMEKADEAIANLSKMQYGTMEDAVNVVRDTFGAVDDVDLPTQHVGEFNKILEECLRKENEEDKEPPGAPSTAETLSQQELALSQQSLKKELQDMKETVNVLTKQHVSTSKELARTNELLAQLASRGVHNGSVDAKYASPRCSDAVVNKEVKTYIGDQELLGITGAIGAEWSEIGICLDLSQQELDQLTMNHPLDSKQRCFQMFQKWKQRQSLETDMRGKLVDCLRRVKLVALAEKVEKGYGGHEENGITKQPVTGAGDATSTSAAGAQSTSAKGAPAVKPSQLKMSTISQVDTAKSKAAKMTGKQLKSFLKENGIDIKGIFEKKDLQDLAIEEMKKVEKGQDGVGGTKPHESSETTQQASISPEDIPSTSAVGSDEDHKPSTSTEGQDSQMSTETVRNEVLQLSLKELRAILDANNTDYKGIKEKSELQKLVIKIKQDVLSSITNQKSPTETKNNGRKRKASREDDVLSSITNQKLPTETKNNGRKRKASKEVDAGKPTGRNKAIRNIKKEEKGVTWYLHGKISSLQDPFPCKNQSLKLQMVIDDGNKKIDAIGFFKKPEFDELYNTLTVNNWYLFEKVDVQVLQKQFTRVARHKYQINITSGSYIKPAPSPASS